MPNKAFVAYDGTNAGSNIFSADVPDGTGRQGLMVAYVVLRPDGTIVPATPSLSNPGNVIIGMSYSDDADSLRISSAAAVRMVFDDPGLKIVFLDQSGSGER